MNRVLKVIWAIWVLPLFLYGIIWAAFRYWLDFSNTQSIVFALLFGSCYFGFKELSKKAEKPEDFIPYRISITIHNPYDFLVKYKFAKTEEDWKHICEQTNDTSIFRRGLNFTVLSLSKNGSPHLIWWDDYKTFLAGLPSFEDAIQGLEFPSTSKRLPDCKWSPRLYFGYRHGSGRGYRLAICVRDKWWEENETESVETEKEYHTGSIYIVVGTLPYGEIGLAYEARHEDRKTELEKFGWTIKDSHELEIDWHNIEVQNEYFSVSQRFLETD